VACFGELGLSGELRSVAHPDRRQAEAVKFGLTPVIDPSAKTLRAAIRAVLPRGGGAAEGGLMHETPGRSRAAARPLLDASYAAAGEHLLPHPLSPTSASPPSRSPSGCQGMVLLSLATATADGRPIVGPVDSIFFRGAFVFGSAPDSIRFRHIRARPAVSATHLPGEELSVTVHGRAVRSTSQAAAAADAARRLRASVRRELGVVHGLRARLRPH
jgi:hypothetical protein